MLRITPKQARTVHRLARDQSCNCADENCLLLDNGDSHPCVQMISLCVMVS
ncbi:MAG: cysteine-rich VLP protein, partial [Clostridia bacterium]|nr:cysteine-rich VLP protein [Clostridia bacterium]